MSIETPVPRTAVSYGIVDPVEKARAELKAALAAIEEKTNVPKQVALKTDRAVTSTRRFVNDNPTLGVAAVVGVAVVVGGAVWGFVRLFTR